MARYLKSRHGEISEISSWQDILSIFKKWHKPSTSTTLSLEHGSPWQGEMLSMRLDPVPQLTNINHDQSSTYPNACPALHWGRHRLSSAFGACPALMAVIIFTTSCHVFAVSMWDQLWLANIWNCWCEVLVRSSVWDCVCVCGVNISFNNVI